MCNMDDFLIRMLKDCIQLGARPRIVNTVNSVPVNHVARVVVVAAALDPLPSGIHAVHVTGNPRLRIDIETSLARCFIFTASELPILTHELTILSLIMMRTQIPLMSILAISAQTVHLASRIRLFLTHDLVPMNGLAESVSEIPLKNTGFCTRDELSSLNTLPDLFTSSEPRIPASSAAATLRRRRE